MLQAPGQFSLRAIEYVQAVCDISLQNKAVNNLALIDAARLVRIIERAEQLVAKSGLSHVQKEFWESQLPALTGAVRGLCFLPTFLEPDRRARSGLGECDDILAKSERLLPKVVQKLIGEARRIIQFGLTEHAGAALSSLVEDEGTQG